MANSIYNEKDWRNERKNDYKRNGPAETKIRSSTNKLIKVINSSEN